MNLANKPQYFDGNNLPWKSIFVSVTKFFFLQAFLGTLVSAIFAQMPGLLGYLSGATLVFICFTIGVTVAALAGRRSMTDAARSMVVAYVVKVMILGMALMLIPMPDIIQNGWMLAGAIVSVVVWLAVEMRAMMRLRILYFDTTE